MREVSVGKRYLKVVVVLNVLLLGVREKGLVGFNLHQFKLLSLTLTVFRESEVVTV